MTSSNEMAKERTDWAEDRTILANERTFAGWMRTGMASLGVALGLRALFGEFEPTWLPKTVSTIFVLTAILIFWAARRQACATIDRLNDHQAKPQSPLYMTTLASVLSIASAATGIVLWWL